MGSHTFLAFSSSERFCSCLWRSMYFRSCPKRYS